MNELETLSRNEMKNIKAGAYACGYMVENGWTGKLDRCTMETTTISGGGGLGVPYVQLEAGVSQSTTEEICCYKAYDPYDLGITGERCINGAKARQC